MSIVSTSASFLGGATCNLFAMAAGASVTLSLFSADPKDHAKNSGFMMAGGALGATCVNLFLGQSAFATGFKVASIAMCTIAGAVQAFMQHPREIPNTDIQKGIALLVGATSGAIAGAACLSTHAALASAAAYFSSKMVYSVTCGATSAVAKA